MQDEKPCLRSLGGQFATASRKVGLTLDCVPEIVMTSSTRETLNVFKR